MTSCGCCGSKVTITTLYQIIRNCSCHMTDRCEHCSHCKTHCTDVKKFI